MTRVKMARSVVVQLCRGVLRPFCAIVQLVFLVRATCDGWLIAAIAIAVGRARLGRLGALALLGTLNADRPRSQGCWKKCGKE
jgi:hypothetical protein